MHCVINSDIKDLYSIQEYPPVALHGTDMFDFQAQNLEMITVGDAELSVAALANSPLTMKQSSYCLLAMLGVSNEAIAAMTGRSFFTVKAQLARSLERVGAKSRSGLGRILLDCEVIQIKQPGAAIGATKAELPVIVGLTKGLGNKQIGSITGLSAFTVHSHLSRISYRSGWNCRELIGLSAMLSGEVGDYKPGSD